MASTEMIQMCRQTLISTPPNNPDLPQSLSFILSDAHQFIDMVKAIVATQIASPHCARSVKSPILQTPSPPVTSLEQLLIGTLCMGVLTKTFRRGEHSGTIFFLEMLDHCKNRRGYVIVDAPDECQDEGMAELLKLIVRTGLNHSSKIKWLITSRPLDSAERELLAGSDQVLVSLELNSKHVAEAVKTYIAARTTELDRRQNYELALRQEVAAELTEKAENTFLWVSLVCKRLESVCRSKVLTMIQDLPPGLYPFYDRIFGQLGEGESAVVERCMRLLKVMLVVYRPLTMEEVGSVTGLSDDEVAIEALVDRCASFVKKREANIEFVHQSARDYLGGKDGQSILDSHEHYGHGEIALSCLSYLSQRLKVNLVDLPRPGSSGESMKELRDMKRNALLASMDYATTFWVQHLEDAKRTTLIQNALGEQGETSLLRAIKALKTLIDATDIYSSAIIFSPQTSVVRRDNLDKILRWLKKLPQVEEVWASLIQTLAGHSGSVWAVAFSPDGKRIASGSGDKTIKISSQDVMMEETIKRLLGL